MAGPGGFGARGLRGPCKARTNGEQRSVARPTEARTLRAGSQGRDLITGRRGGAACRLKAHLQPPEGGVPGLTKAQSSQDQAGPQAMSAFQTDHSAAGVAWTSLEAGGQLEG